MPQGDVLPAPDPGAELNNWLAASKKAGVRALQVRFLPETLGKGLHFVKTGHYATLHWRHFHEQT